MYPHSRGNLALQDVVEVMIACHDSLVAEKIVQFCGEQVMINNKIKTYFKNINITQNLLSTKFYIFSFKKCSEETYDSRNIFYYYYAFFKAG